RSPWGRMMRAIRDNETAAAALGKNIAYRRLQAFVFGACLMGLGGALLAHFNRSITPEGIDPMIATFLIWIMLILGGSGNNRGAILGTAVVWIIWSMSEIVTDQLPTEVAIQAKYIRMFLIGLMLQLVRRFRPEGLLPEEPTRRSGGPNATAADAARPRRRAALSSLTSAPIRWRRPSSGCRRRRRTGRRRPARRPWHRTPCRRRRPGS
ncbi:MAG: branched-chain amino acid ABC transporter permease, partial [Kiloniellaceae bacterium]